MNKVLVIAPHPDDETLGCGGTLLKQGQWKMKFTGSILTNITEKDGWNLDQVNCRQEEIDQVAEAYGFNSLHKMDFSSTKLDSLPISALVGSISDVVKKIGPNTIYVNNHRDIHTDHQIAFGAVMSSVKSFNQPYIKRVLMYETISETEFAAPQESSAFYPNVFVDISDYFKIKSRIFQIYKSEVMNAPFPRSLEVIEALAKYRGSRIGVKYAEAFSLLYEKA